MGPGSHSPVGASSMKRVLACPASVAIATGIEDEESDHAALGTAVHSLIEASFRQGTDAWQYIGRIVEADGFIAHPSESKGGITVNRQMSVAAQAMLDAVRKAHPDRNQGNFWVERRFHCPTIHPLFFGTSDVICLKEDPILHGLPVLHVWDYKNGAGVIIECEENPQLMYYACGALEDLALWDKVDSVVLHVVQPNGFHSDGPVREWTTTPDHLAEWLEDTLIPGIEAAVGDGPKTAASGEHCRFCPARTRACPQLVADMEALQQMVEMIQKSGAEELTNEQVQRFLDLLEVAKIVGKEASKTAFRRIQAGNRIPGYKLAKSKANRVWKAGAEAEAKAEFGAAAFTAPEFKSPAQIDEMPMGAAFTSRYAYKPDTGLTLAKGTDSRPEVSTDTKSLFKPVAVQKQITAPTPIPAPAAGRRMRTPLTAVN